MAERSNDLTIIRKEEEINRAVSVVEHTFSGFINQQNNWEFFRGLGEYVKLVQDLGPTKPMIEALEQQRQMARKMFEATNTRALRETIKSATEMVKIAQKVGNQVLPVQKSLQVVQDQLNGKLLTSLPLPTLNRHLFDLAITLKQSGYADLIKQFEDANRQRENIFGNYTFAPSYEKSLEEKEELERKKKTEVWGDWEELPLVHRLIFEPEVLRKEMETEVKKDPNAQLTMLNLIGVIGEMDKIRSGSIADNDIVYFRVGDFRSHARRVHQYLTTGLLKAYGEVDIGHPPKFDSKTGILDFMGKKIPTAKRSQSYGKDLLATLFKEPSKEWHTDEILEDWVADLDVPKRRPYNAGKAINKEVASKTLVEDFLIINTTKISINPKYLKN